MSVNPKTYIDPSDVSGALVDMASVANSITARAGGGAASATQLTKAMNRVTTVASAGDSVKLPAAKVGMRVFVANVGANSMNVFPATGENINLLADDTAFAVASTRAAMFFCCVNGFWNAVYGA